MGARSKLLWTERRFPSPQGPNRPAGWRWALLVAAALVVIVAGVAGKRAWDQYYHRQRAPLAASGGWYFWTRLELPVGLFTQNDPQWGEDLLGPTDQTMGEAGCAVSSAAMILRFYGLDTDPGRLNQFLEEHEGYTAQGWLKWEAVEPLAPGKVRHAYEDLPSYALIDSNLARGNPVIVRVRLPSGITHFVVVMGKTGFDYLIRDPSGEGRRRGVYPLKDFGRPIEALRFYEKIAATKPGTNG